MYYKSPDNKIHWLDDVCFEYLLPLGSVGISDEEANQIIEAAQEAAPTPTPEQILQFANNERDSRLGVAALRIAPLQDAVDLDEATTADIANLKLWKQYRVAVNRVGSQAGFPAVIDWPVQPA